MLLGVGCGKKDTAESGNATDKIVTSSAQTENGNVNVDLSIFAAKSLNSVMDEICAAYTKEHYRSLQYPSFRSLQKVLL